MLSQIKSRYNPENDVRPDGPPVTWAEYELYHELVSLREIVKDLEARARDLEARIRNLEDQNKRLRQAAIDTMTLASGESLE